MSESLILQKDSIGIDFIIKITTDGYQPVDLSSCSAFYIYFHPPNSKQKYSVNASLYTDGTDGKIHYISTSSDLTVKGRWRIQASYERNGSIRYTSFDYFIVNDNI